LNEKGPRLTHIKKLFVSYFSTIKYILRSDLVRMREKIEGGKKGKNKIEGVI